MFAPVRFRTTAPYRRARLLACLTTAALAAPLTVPSQASADPVSDKRAKAAAIADQISRLGFQEAALSEHYDAAVLAEQQATSAVDKAAAQAAAAQAASEHAKIALRSDAIGAYTRGGNSTVTAGGTQTLNDAQSALLRVEYARTLASGQMEDYDRYRTAQGTAQAAKTQLDDARQQAAQQVSTTESARRAVAKTSSDLQGTYQQVQGQLATLVAQAQATQEAERARQAQAAALARQQAAQRQTAQAAVATTLAPTATRSSSTSGSSQGPERPAASQPTAAPSLPGPQVSSGAPVPSGSGGGAAVSAALSRVGDPYVYGAAGPSTFDCSGLTMWAWNHAGVSLPHYSGAQYDATTHIPMSQLQPGDLVFFANPGEHEAMYIGGGQIVEAPYTGANVRVEPLYSQFVLASRP